MGKLWVTCFWFYTRRNWTEIYSAELSVLICVDVLTKYEKFNARLLLKVEWLDALCPVCVGLLMGTLVLSTLIHRWTCLAGCTGLTGSTMSYLWSIRIRGLLKSITVPLWLVIALERDVDFLPMASLAAAINHSEIRRDCAAFASRLLVVFIKDCDSCFTQTGRACLRYVRSGN